MLHRQPRPTLFPYTTLFRSTKDQSPQVNLRDGFNRAREGAISSTRPCIATPRLGPIASTTIAARGSEDRLRRSEEHTSELQSRFDLVCRLLLEKKNNTI